MSDEIEADAAGLQELYADFDAETEILTQIGNSQSLLPILVVLSSLATSVTRTVQVIRMATRLRKVAMATSGLTLLRLLLFRWVA